AVLAFCLPLAVFGQTNFSTQIIVSDQDGNSDTLTLGVNTAASYGVDPAFGETELPPVPPTGVFDARFIDIPGRSTTPPDGHGQGLSVDIRNLADDFQPDTFRIRFQHGSETGTNVTFQWDPNLAALGGGRWRLSNSLSLTPLLDVDMTEQSSVTIDNDEYSAIYISKGDSTSYRSFSLATLALDVDAKNKKGKAIPKKSNQVEFCMTVPNNEPVPVNGLFIQFKTPVDSTTVVVSPFTTIATDPKQKPGAKTKYWFSGATVDTGNLISICGYGVKDGTKLQGVASWYVTNGGVIVGKKKTQKIGVSFSQNEVRLPMPNTINLGEQMMLQALPLKTDYLVVGSTLPIDGPSVDTFRYVLHKKYMDVLKSLIKDYGAKGYVLQDSLASCMDYFDDKKYGYRYFKKPIKVKQKSLPPDKHRNRLFGEALTLKVNILFSQTQKTPVGLGELMINDPTSPFYGMRLDTLATRADEYLTFCSIASAPVVTADELADLLAELNSAFEGPMDTVVWSLSKIQATGARAIGDLAGLVKRAPGVEPKIIPDLSGLYQQVPGSYELQQNYPNPFNPATVIRYSLSVNSLVTLKVFNVLGQEVATLLNNIEQKEGDYEQPFNAAILPSGIYFYRIAVNDASSGAVTFQQTKKMMLVK
ncbi:MAG: T9SS type A sorting domain-containing protein, partial [Bacteroidetes bacterium]